MTSQSCQKIYYLSIFKHAGLYNQYPYLVYKSNI
jgi:hypothetical protein